MVTTFLPATSEICSPQARTASPPRWSVEAPHSATPQPNLVPVRPTSSRKNHMSGIEGSPSNLRSCPFTWKLGMASSTPAHFLYTCMVALTIDCPKRKEQPTSIFLRK